MRLDIEVRSSGWGPRARRCWGVEVFWPYLGDKLGDVVGWWPRDGVAVIIRRVGT